MAPCPNMAGPTKLRENFFPRYASAWPALCCKGVTSGLPGGCSSTANASFPCMEHSMLQDAVRTAHWAACCRFSLLSSVNSLFKVFSAGWIRPPAPDPLQTPTFLQDEEGFPL